MSDINEIQGQPDEVNEQGSNPKGVKLFFGEKEAALFSRLGREITEDWLQESFLLYRIDLQKTRGHKLYGEAKNKVTKPSVEVFGRINVEANPTEYHTQGGAIKRGMGKLTAHIYLEYLEEKGLVLERNGQHLKLDMQVGDFIAYKNQYYEIKDDGFSQISNQHSWAGDRRFYITVEAVEVDEDRFKAR